MKFGKRLRSAINRAGISQRRAADMLGVSLSTLEDWISDSPRRGEPHRLMQLGVFSVMRMAGRGAARTDWKPRMLAQLGAVPDTTLARRYGASAASIRRLREARNIPAVGKTGIRSAWNDDVIAMLGEVPDRVVAERVGLTIGSVASKRRNLGIPAHRKHHD